MCGIIGVTGVEDPLGVVLEGLRLLEYRGYDSAGVVLSAKGGAGPSLWRRRAAVQAASISELENDTKDAPCARSGLGHTRWATHGRPTEENAHPHLDCSGEIAVVHNGIIENYRQLAAELDAEGHKRTSETDTEVVAHLLERELAKGSTLAEAMRHVAGVLRGDFALAAISSREPDTIVATRQTSPLIVGKSDSAGVVSSDIAAALSTTRELYAISDGEVATVRPGEIEVVDLAGSSVEPLGLEVSWSVSDARLEGYEDFMSKEIDEQPRAIGDTLMGRITDGKLTELEELGLSDEELAAIRRVVFVACGSSYHAGLVGRAAVERWAGLEASAEIASEFRYREPVLDEATLVVAISQSGETADSFHALEEARRRGRERSS